MRPLARRGAYTLTWPVFLFVAAAVVAASQIGEGLLTDVTLNPFVFIVGSLLPRLGLVATPLIGAALLLRHPDAHRRLPLMLLGAVLVALDAVVRPFVDRLAALLSPVPPFESADLMTVVALQSLASLLGGFGVAYLARGLSQARRYADRGPLRSVVNAVVIAMLVTFALVLIATFASNGLPGDGLAVVAAIGSLGSLVVSVLALGYLAGTATRGRFAGELPGRAWALAAIGAWLLFGTSVGWTAVAWIAEILELYEWQPAFQIMATLAAIGAITLVLAFLDGLPEVDDIKWFDLAELDAEAARGRADGTDGDPFADGDDGAGAQLFELEDRRLDA